MVPGRRTYSAVVFIDAVKSTAQMVHSEEATLKALHEDLEIFREVATRYGVASERSTGDGLLWRFDSPVVAIRCCMAIQDILAGRVGTKPQLEYRMGMHAGDVEVADDVFGAVPNLASRIQGAAKPGQIAMSGHVRDVVKNFIDVRPQRLSLATPLKDVPPDLPVFIIPIDPQKIESVTPAGPRPNVVIVEQVKPRKERVWPKVAALLAFFCVVGAAVRFADGAYLLSLLNPQPKVKPKVEEPAKKRMKRPIPAPKVDDPEPVVPAVNNVEKFTPRDLDPDTPRKPTEKTTYIADETRRLREKYYPTYDYDGFLAELPDSAIPRDAQTILKREATEQRSLSARLEKFLSGLPEENPLEVVTEYEGVAAKTHFFGNLDGSLMQRVFTEEEYEENGETKKRLTPSDGSVAFPEVVEDRAVFLKIGQAALRHPLFPAAQRSQTRTWLRNFARLNGLRGQLVN